MGQRKIMEIRRYLRMWDNKNSINQEVFNANKVRSSEKLYP